MTPRASRSAPFDASSLTISAWLCAAAHISGVWPPNTSLALMSAPAPSSRHQRRLAFRVPRVRVGAGLDERVDDRRGSDGRGFGQRGRAELVLQLHVRAD